MNSADKDKFKKALSMCIAATGKTAPESISSAFWVILEPYPLVEVVKALKMRMSDPDKGRFIPSAVEIKTLIENNRPKPDNCKATLQPLYQKPTDKMVDIVHQQFSNLSEHDRRRKIFALRLSVGGGKSLSQGFNRKEHDALLKSRRKDQ